MGNIQNKLIDIFENTGICINREDTEELLDLDSLHYISIICEIENEFDVEIPDEMLSRNPLETFKDFEKMILQLRKE